MAEKDPSTLEGKVVKTSSSGTRTPSGRIVYSTRKGFEEPTLKRVRKYIKYQPAESGTTRADYPGD